MSDAWAEMDATGQAEAVRRGDASPLELVEAAIARIEALDPKLNAVIHESFERARSEAAEAETKLPDGPFRGVPFLLKDLACGNRAGDPIHWGTRFLKDAKFCATTSSNIVRRFLAAGLVVVGRTNVPELGAWSITESDAYGPCRNPWNTDHASGGSSGGAAAATAAGLVPFAHASDGGGSIRNPASQCGLVGLKPSRGRVSLGPDIADSWAGMTFEFAVTRSVRDAATLLDCVSGPMIGDPYAAWPPVRPFADEVGTDPGVLRVGLVEQQLDGEPLHPECAQAVQRTARQLEALGHRVEVATPDALSSDALLPHVLNVISASQARDVAHFEELLGRPLGPEDLDADNWRITEMGRAVSASQFIEATEAYNRFRREMLQWWADGFDLLLTPTITRPSPRVGEIVPSPDAPLDAFMRSGALLSFCVPFNITGQPAISLPIHVSAEGLPVGVQLVAAADGEDQLIRIAAQLEEAVGWREQRPPIHA
jgi:amidase